MVRVRLDQARRAPGKDSTGQGGQRSWPKAERQARRLSSSGALHRAFTNRRFKGLGLFSNGYAGGRLIRRTAVVRTRMPGGVGGVAS